MVYMVTYDLRQSSSERYEQITDAIKQVSSAYCHPQLSVWLVRSNLSAKDFYDAIKSATNPNDLCIVIEVTNRYWGRLLDWDEVAGLFA